MGLAVVLIVLAQSAPQFYQRWLDSEARGVLSLLQFVFPALAFVVAVRILTLPTLRDEPWLYTWVEVAALSCFYIAGEEASWGQHYLGWVTPQTWSITAGFDPERTFCSHRHPGLSSIIFGLNQDQKGSYINISVRTQ